MRATLTTAALTLTALLCAGSSLALIDGVDEITRSATHAADDTLAFAGGLGQDAQNKAAAAGSIATAVAANAAGQAGAAGDLATAVAGNVAVTAMTIVEMELHAVDGAANAATACSAAAGAPFEAQACLQAAANQLVEA